MILLIQMDEFKWILLLIKLYCFNELILQQRGHRSRFNILIYLNIFGGDSFVLGERIAKLGAGLMKLMWEKMKNKEKNEEK